MENLRADPRKASKMAAHAGPTSVIAEIEQDLLDFVEMWRQKGFEVNRFTLLRKAKELIPDVLEHHSEGAAKICLSRFLAKRFLFSATLFLSVVSCFRFLRLFCDRSPIAKNSPPLRFFTFSLLLFLFLFFCCFEFSNFELWSCQPIFVAFLHSQDLPTIFHSSQISPSPLLHASSWFTPGAPHSLNRAL